MLTDEEKNGKNKKKNKLRKHQANHGDEPTDKKGRMETLWR